MHRGATHTWWRAKTKKRISIKKLGKKKEFEQWYEAQKDVVFDLDNERYEYCVSDVLILKKAMETYRDLCIEKFNLDPLKCVTIASFSMKNYRTNFMKEDNLAVLTKTEYVTDIRIVYVFVLSYTSYFHIVEVKYGWFQTRQDILT